MPYTTVQVKANALRTEVIASVPMDQNRLIHVSAHMDDGLGDPAGTYVVIEISRADTKINSRVALLTQGYLGGSTGVYWHGRIPMEPDLQINMRVWSSFAGTVHLSVISEITE